MIITSYQLHCFLQYVVYCDIPELVWLSKFDKCEKINIFQQTRFCNIFIFTLYK
jgi:hypothetical protein